MTAGESVLLTTVANNATATACTTKRVLLVNDEPRGSWGKGTLLSAVVKVVCTVMPSATPRSANKNMIKLIGVVA